MDINEIMNRAKAAQAQSPQPTVFTASTFGAAA